MAKSRIGHIVEAQILQAIGVDYIDESEVLTPADPSLHVNKHVRRFNTFRVLRGAKLTFLPPHSVVQGSLSAFLVIYFLY